MEVNQHHTRVLRHMLGLDKDVAPDAGGKPWRNTYVAGEGHEAMPFLNELLVNDFVTVRDNPGGSGYLFRATDKGIAVARSEAVAPE